MRQSFSRFSSCTKQLDVNQGKPTRIHKLRDMGFEKITFIQAGILITWPA